MKLVRQIGVGFIAAALALSLSACGSHDEKDDTSSTANTKSLDGDGSSTGATKKATPTTPATKSATPSKKTDYPNKPTTDLTTDKSLPKSQVEYMKGLVEYVGGWATTSYKKGSYPSKLELGEDPSVIYGVDPELSGPDSLCVYVKTVEYQEGQGIGGIVFYDSQTKKVVKEGQSCKDPIGTTFADGANG